MVFAAQLWKYTSGRLENKNGHSMFKEEIWILSDENSNSEGQEIRDSLGRVLKVLSNNTGMRLKILNTKKFCTLEIFLVSRHPILRPAIASCY